MKTRDINSIPSNVNHDKVYDKLSRISSMSFFKNHDISKFTYLGGCSNHALTSNNKDGYSFIVRLPGSQSEIFIDREAEIHNQHIVTHLGLCPKLDEAHGKGELKGYKVEQCLTGQPLSFDNFSQFQTLALATIKKIHDSGQQFKTQFDVFTRIILMCETLLSNGINFLSWNNRKNTIPLINILEKVQLLQDKFEQLFGKSHLVPCHNDLGPSNFILDEMQNSLKIIDWETSGMNDKMYDLAFMASIMNMSYTDITHLVRDYYSDTEHHLDDINKVFFLQPLVDINIGLWAYMQVNMRNESKPHELRNGWGPTYIPKFWERIETGQYVELLNSVSESHNRVMLMM